MLIIYTFSCLILKIATASWETADGDIAEYRNSTSNQKMYYIELYEAMAISTFSVMLLVILFIFCWGCQQDRDSSVWVSCGDLCRDFRSISSQCITGIIRDTSALVIQGTVTLSDRLEMSSSGRSIAQSKAAIDLARSSPRVATKLMSKALDAYYNEFGHTDVPETWVVPCKSPWAKETWGLELGRMVWALGYAVADVGGATATFPNSSQEDSAKSSKAEDSNHIKPAIGSEANPYHHPSETWYELFYDLVFVASALQLGLIIKYDHRILGLLKAGILFCMLRGAWDQLTSYQIRFHQSDVTHMAYYILQFMGAFVIALHLQIKESVHSENEHSWERSAHQLPIALMAACVRILTVLMYVLQLTN